MKDVGRPGGTEQRAEIALGILRNHFYSIFAMHFIRTQLAVDLQWKNSGTDTCGT